MIEMKNISAGYGRKTVLDGVSAVFKKGDLTCIAGPNGCGKSTLLKAMLGILPLLGGEILFDGRSLSSLTRNEIAKRAAYLSQSKNTPDMTVFQMVLHGRFSYLSYPRRYSERDKEIAYEAVRSVGICDLADEKLTALSGGMRQNAYIAMALAQTTDYIILDEPTTYLDIQHQLALMRLLRTLADSGKGIITVMHDLPFAFEFSDKVLILDGGRSIIEGAPSELYNSPLMKDIFGVGIKRIEGKYYYDTGKNSVKM